jgi:hypothetical protein
VPQERAIRVIVVYDENPLSLKSEIANPFVTWRFFQMNGEPER